MHHIKLSLLHEDIMNFLDFLSLHNDPRFRFEINYETSGDYIIATPYTQIGYSQHSNAINILISGENMFPDFNKF